MFIVKRNRSLSPPAIDSTFFKPYEILNSKTEILNKSKLEHSNSKPGWENIECRTRNVEIRRRKLKTIIRENP